jgi:hypothetical protein
VPPTNEGGQAARPPRRPVRGLRAILLALAVGGPGGLGPRAAAAQDAPVFNARTGLHEVPLERLEGALARSDRAELARYAERIGAARLGAALLDGSPKLLPAVLEGVAELPGNLRLVDRVAYQVDNADPAIAARAARVLGRILGEPSPIDVDQWDVPPDAVSAACATLTRTSTNVTQTMEVRLAALEALGSGAAFCNPDPALAALFEDPNADLRRAAILVAPIRQATFAREIAARIEDPVARVASAAGAVLCSRREVFPNQAIDMSAGRVRTPTRFRTLILSQATPVEDAVEMLPCLRASPEPEDRRTFEEIRNGKAGPLRDRARELAAPEAP